MEADDDTESDGLPPSYEQLGDELPACAVCLQGLGLNGGPASLPCGHNGCLLCLQQVQASQPRPLCPLCRTPFDPELPLCQNTELRDALERILQASQMMRYAELQEQRAAAQREQERAVVETKTKKESDSSRLREAGHAEDPLDNWVAVSQMPGRGNHQWLADDSTGHQELDAEHNIAGYPVINSGIDMEPRVTQYTGELEFARSPRANGGGQASSRTTDVNLWNVMAGMMALATGRGGRPGSQPTQGNQTLRHHEQSIGQTEAGQDLQWEALDNELPGAGDMLDGDSSPERQTRSYISGGIHAVNDLGWSSSGSQFLRPTAPPLMLSGTGEDVRVLRAVLEAEPPQWVPDSGSTCCMQCAAPFRPVTCFRHHCRFCGGLFCNRCTRGRSLLPVQFRQHDPQRVCDTCHERLEPLQRVLADRVSNAAQVALHDVTDWSSFRGWINNPLASSLQEEIYKATATLRSYSLVGRLKPERSIPEAVLSGAVGLAIITVAKLGCMVTYKLGTGLVVARRPDGSWSAPSAVATAGMGWGLQIGGELTDLIVVLRTNLAVKAFCGRGHVAVGAGLSAAAGPLGRHAEADLRLGDKGAASCYSYSCSKGAFVGVSVESNIVATRTEANVRFYGDPKITASSILLGSVPPPRAAAPLFAALSDLFGKLEGPLNCETTYF